MSDTGEDSSVAQFTSEESKVSELFQLIHASLREGGHQPPGVVSKDLSFLQAGDADSVGCKQIGVDDGYVNYIYRLGGGGDGAPSIVVKWAREIPRVAEANKIRPDPELAKQAKRLVCRNGDECCALLQIEQLVPGSAPQVYWLDVDRHFFLMQDLADSDTLRQRLVDGEDIKEAFHNIADFFGRLHGSTFISQLSKEKYEMLSKVGPPMVLLDRMTKGMIEESFRLNSPSRMIRLENRVYTEEMKTSGALQQIIDNPDIKDVTKRLAGSFRRRICLVHNDSHPGAFMVSPDQVVKVIDYEFSTFGNPAKEIGYGLGEVIMFYRIYRAKGEKELAQKLVHATRSYLRRYLSVVGEIVLTEVPDFWQLLSGHAGHFAGLRTVGTMIPFPHFQGLEQAEIESAKVATRLMKKMDEVKSLDDFINMAFPDTV